MGYHYPAPVIRYEGDPESEFAGLWIRINQVRTGEELRALRGATYWRDLIPVMAPYIVEWNYEGLREYTETIPAEGGLPEREVVRLRREELPAPADEPDALKLVDVPVLSWIYTRLFASVGWRPEGDDPKAQTPSGDTPSGDSSETPTDSTGTNPSPTNRRARGN